MGAFLVYCSIDSEIHGYSPEAPLCFLRFLGGASDLQAPLEPRNGEAAVTNNQAPWLNEVPRNFGRRFPNYNADVTLWVARTGSHCIQPRYKLAIIEVMRRPLEERNGLKPCVHLEPHCLICTYTLGTFIRFFSGEPAIANYTIS